MVNGQNEQYTPRSKEPPEDEEDEDEKKMANEHCTPQSKEKDRKFRISSKKVERKPQSQDEEVIQILRHGRMEEIWHPAPRAAQTSQEESQ